MTTNPPTTPTLTPGSPRPQSWAGQICALVVAGVAAYSSYAHQRQFALDGGADPLAAALWPLSVDGLVILASIGLLKNRSRPDLRARCATHLAFVLGIAVSLAANIAAAPSFAWQPIVVAGWPALALLLAVELVMHSRHRDRPAKATENPAISTYRETSVRPRPGASESESPSSLARLNGHPGSENGRRAVSKPKTSRRAPRSGNAEDVMWEHYQREQAQGRTPTGADLDRAAGTSNYGRAVLARWRRTGRIPMAGTQPVTTAV